MKEYKEELKKTADDVAEQMRQETILEEYSRQSEFCLTEGLPAYLQAVIDTLEEATQEGYDQLEEEDPMMELNRDLSDLIDKIKAHRDKELAAGL